MLHKAPNNHFGVFVVDSPAGRTHGPHLLVAIRNSQFRRAPARWAERDPRLGHSGGRRGSGGAGAGVGGRHPERAEAGGGGGAGQGSGGGAAEEEAGGVGEEQVVGSEEEHGARFSRARLVAWRGERRREDGDLEAEREGAR